MLFSCEMFETSMKFKCIFKIFKFFVFHRFAGMLGTYFHEIRCCKLVHRYPSR
jgi:hypothetical protein